MNDQNNALPVIRVMAIAMVASVCSDTVFFHYKLPQSNCFSVNSPKHVCSYAVHSKSPCICTSHGSFTTSFDVLISAAARRQQAGC